MDMDHGGRRWRLVVLGAAVAAGLTVPACTTEVQTVGQPQVRVRQDQREVLGTAKILRDGEQVGSLRTMRLRGPSGTSVVHQVQDMHMNSLGFIDERCCAYRLSAYAGSEFVANSSDRRRNVAAILGAYGANIELIEEQPAAVVEKTDAAGSRRAR